MPHSTTRLPRSANSRPDLKPRSGLAHFGQVPWHSPGRRAGLVALDQVIAQDASDLLRGALEADLGVGSKLVVLLTPI